jgi:hypothetical protein
MKEHPRLFLGKKPPQKDARTLALSSFLKPDLKVPPEYDFDLKNRDIPTPMLGNDKESCCVITARAHQTLRFEKTEQGVVIPITEGDVHKQYRKESGGEDFGLNMLASLKSWRKKGWRAGSQVYDIFAFGSLYLGSGEKLLAVDFLALQQAIVYLTGVQVGLDLPLSAQDQFDQGLPWTVTEGPKARPGTWGGHAILIPGYTALGPTCATWARKQSMSWPFFFKYADEAYGVVDNRDRWLGKKSPVDIAKLTEILQTVTTKKAA